VAELVRFTVSLESDLLAAFDRYCTDGRFATRSEAVRQLLRERLAAAEWQADERPMTATLTLVYDHHRAHLTEKLIQLQHAHTEQVISTLHVHLDHDHCLEVIVLRGRPGELRRLAGELRGLKGVHKGELTLADTAPHDGHGQPGHHHH
jgi:CopG family transcriptional regulator, nickel-responsive regulator